MYTAQQVNEAVEAFGNDFYRDLDEGEYTREYPVGHWLHGRYREAPAEGWSDVEYSSFIIIDGKFVDYEVVDTTGGMDKGSNASVTIKIGDQYFRKEGYYASHYGYDWDGPLREVVPVEKIVTVYEPKE